MRNLPLVAFRLTDGQRTPAEAEAARRGLTLNEMAKRSLLAEIERVNSRVNTGGVRELTVVRDE